MATIHYLAAKAAYDDLSSQSAWREAIVTFVQQALDGLEARGGDFVNARQVATWALIEAAATFAVHDTEALSPGGEPQPNEVAEKIADLQQGLGLALIGELHSHDLIKPNAA